MKVSLPLLVWKRSSESPKSSSFVVSVEIRSSRLSELQIGRLEAELDVVGDLEERAHRSPGALDRVEPGRDARRVERLGAVGLVVVDEDVVRVGEGGERASIFAAIGLEAREDSIA